MGGDGIKLHEGMLHEHDKLGGRGADDRDMIWCDGDAEGLFGRGLASAI